MVRYPQHSHHLYRYENFAGSPDLQNKKFCGWAGLALTRASDNSDAKSELTPCGREELVLTFLVVGI